jgi:hypothetical protein
MNIRGLVVFAILGAVLLFPGGCQKDQNDKTGTIVMKISDAPFPIGLIDEANVKITKVEIRNQEETEEKPFLTLMEEDMEFNLLELRNGVSAKLLEMEVPVGNYDLIRLYVEDASIKVKDFDTYSVKVPSGAQTGIKVFIKPALKIAGGLTTEVLLDVNVDKSFVLKGNMDTPAGIKGFNFKPVIRAVNNTTAGVVEGVVMDPDSVLLSDASVWIEQDTVVTSAFTDSEGFYAMPGILAGIYSISAVKEGFDTLTFEGVEVVEGNLTVQNFLLEATVE